MTRRIKGILFDLGDTLLDFNDVDLPRLFQAGAELAYAYLQSLNHPLPPFNKFCRRQYRAIRWRYFLSHITGKEFNSLDLMVRLSKRMGHDLTHEQSLELSWKWYEPLGKQASVEAGTADMLRTFVESGLTLGMVSNTFVPGEVLDRHLAQVGLLELLPMRIYSSDIGIRKPNRKIFELAFQQTSLQAEETIFVGDSPHADIKGANRLSMISILKDPTGKYARSRITPTHRIQSILELADIVANYNNQ